MKHLLVMVLAFVAAGGGVQAEQPSVDTPRWTVQEAAAALEPGWNLGNTLEGVPTEGAWGNPPVTPEVFDRVRSLGFRSVRIPVAFGTHIGGGPDFRIAAGWLSRIEQVVDQALARDLWVLLDFHDYWQTFRNFRKDPSLQTQKFVALWRQLADRFRDKSPKLLFESINEPGSQTPDSDITAAEVNEWNRLFVETVRSTGGGNRTRFLVLPGRNTDGTEAWKTLELPTDPHGL